MARYDLDEQVIGLEVYGFGFWEGCGCIFRMENGCGVKVLP